MPFFNPSEFEIFSDAHSTDPASDADRVRFRDKLVWLHQQIYPEIRARRWDIHPHWTPQHLISTAKITRASPRIDSLLLRYSKAQTVVKLLKKEFGYDLSHPYSTALLAVRADQRGLGVELVVTDRAWADAQNLKNKLVHGAPEKRHLRQLFAELGGDYTLSYELVDRLERGTITSEVLRVKCSRLVNLGTLDSTLAKFAPTIHQLRVATRISNGDPEMDADALPTALLYRIGQLYMLYQFVSWSPRNDHLTLPKTREQKSDSVT